MKVSLIFDFKEERWPSMERYSQRLYRALWSGYKSDQFDCRVPPFLQFLLPLQPLFKQIPYLRFWGNDLFFNRYITYPIFLKFKQGDINHILDHSYAHLVNFLDPKKTIITCHDLIPIKLHNPALIKDKYLRLFESTVKCLGKAGHVITDSQATKTDLIEKLGINDGKISVIYPGIDSDYAMINDGGILDEERVRRGILKDFINILHVGVNQPYKNVKGIFLAIQRLKNDGLKVNLLKVGQDFTVDQKEFAKGLGIIENIKFLPDVNNEELNLIYNISDLLLFPSFLEGFGFPVVDALACGTPVVCSRGGSLKEAGGDAAFYVDPANTLDIVRGIREALVVRLSSDFKIKQKEWMDWASRFKWEKTAQETYRVYENVLRQQ